MRIPYAIAMMLSLAACQPDGGDDDTVDRATPADVSQAPKPAAPVAEDPDVLTRYACDADTSVVVLRDGGARVSLPEGRDIDLSRIAGSQPPIYTGSSLYFTIGDDRAYLSQGDETNELACSPL